MMLNNIALGGGDEEVLRVVGMEFPHFPVHTSTHHIVPGTTTHIPTGIYCQFLC